MKLKKLAIAVLMMAMLASALAIPASAANNTDVNFNVRATSTTTRYANTETGQRQKQDSSSSYINYSTRTNGSAATGPYQFEAFIYGANTSGSSYVDCSSYTNNGYARSKSIVTRGSVGLIRQDVWEKFYSNDGIYPYGQIWGQMTSSGVSGYARGCWSVDSVGTYSYYNYLL